MTFSNAAFGAFKDHLIMCASCFLLYRLGPDWKKLSSAVKMEKKCCHSVSILKSNECCHFLKDISIKNLKKTIISITFDTIDRNFFVQAQFGGATFLIGFILVLQVCLKTYKF